ncbi:MAG: reverse transcriptase family protein [Acidobacteriota bacterium]
MSNILKTLNLQSLSNIFGISVQEIIKLSKIAPKLYHEAHIPKKNGKNRKLEIPNTNLKQIQRIILHKILDKLYIHPKLFGGPGSSTKKAVAEHTRKHVLITADIKDFFPCVKSYHVRNMFLRYGASEDTSRILTRLLTYKNHLPQGAPTSPAIGRLVLFPFAEELDNLLNKIPKSSFSIYVDDIILSGPKGVKGFLSTIRKMLAHYGFKINKKTKIMYRSEEQVCLNIRVNDGFAPPTNYLNELKKLAEIVPPSNPTLKGKISYINYLRKA